MELLKIVILLKKIKNAQWLKTIQQSKNLDSAKIDAAIIEYKRLALNYSESLTDKTQKEKILNFLKAV